MINTSIQVGDKIIAQINKSRSVKIKLGSVAGSSFCGDGNDGKLYKGFIKRDGEVRAWEIK